MRPCAPGRAAAPRSSGCSRSRCPFGKPVHTGYHADGSFSDAYCDIILPTPNYTGESRELIYTDLYIDVVVRQDGSVFTKDHEVYDRAARRYPIVEESRRKAFETLDWVEAHAKAWSGPFEVIPRHLPRTDWHLLSVEEIRAAMHSALQKEQEQQRQQP